MGATTKIQWCDHTFNAWIGCAKISAGCKHCYAEKDTFARVSRSKGLPLWGQNAARHVTSDGNWKLPLRWNREAAAAGERRRVFCGSLMDVLERPGNRAALLQLDTARAKLWSLIESTKHLDWLLLTKRPDNALALGPIHGFPGHVWIGASVENRAELHRVDALREIPAAVRFLSVEPLLEDLGRLDLRGIHWVIVGGESGRGARPFDVAWARSIVEQCKAAGVACFVKQMGANVWENRGRLEEVVDGRAVLGARITDDGTVERQLRFQDPKGGDPSEWPSELRGREFPRCAVTATAIDGPCPYTVRCIKAPGHVGEHVDEHGFRLPELTKARAV